ncbi:hypothetical protein ACE6H2_000639 [Prunus campanulata]
MLDTTYTTEFLSLNPSTGIWRVSNFGENIIIGIIDTGIWPESPSLGHGAKYFNKGLKENYNGMIVDSARDCVGHGTQVASIAAGNYVERRIFFVMLKELLLKIGLEKNLFDDLLAVTSSSALKNGILVSYAAGNKGPKLRTLLNGYPWVITVASGTIDRWFTGTSTLGNGMYWIIPQIQLDPILMMGKDYEYASPFDMGAGHINPNRALDPGLIYDATLQDYVNLLCSLHYSQDQLFDITGSRVNNCSSPSSDFNYPSIISLYDSNVTQVFEKFRRTVTNVDGLATYNLQ